MGNENKGLDDICRTDGMYGGHLALTAFRKDKTANRVRRPCATADRSRICDPMRHSGLVLRPVPGGQVQRLYSRDLCLRDDLDVEPIVRVQLRDSDGLGVLSQENSDVDLRDAALKPDPNELASELVGVALMHRTHLRRGWSSTGINPLGLNPSA